MYIYIYMYMYPFYAILRQGLQQKPITHGFIPTLNLGEFPPRHQRRRRVPCRPSLAMGRRQ